MPELVRLLLFPCLVLVGWTASRTRCERVRKLMRLLLGIMFGFVPLLIISGLDNGRILGELHKWSGHAFVIVAWLAIPFILGVILQRHVREWPFSSLAQSVALVALLLLVVLCSITGYLGPSYIDPWVNYEETYNRFVVIHVFVLPAIIAALTAGVWWFLRPRVAGPRKHAFTFTVAGLLVLVTVVSVWMALGRLVGFVSMTLFVIAPLPAAGYLVLIRCALRRSDKNTSLPQSVTNIVFTAGLAGAVLLSLAIVFGAFGTLELPSDSSPWFRARPTSYAR